MKKHLLLLAAIITFSCVGAQDNNAWLQSRVLKVDPADVEKFEAAVAKKTRMYNSEDCTPRWITFRILT